MRRLACLILIPALVSCCALAELDAVARGNYLLEQGFSNYNPGTTQLGVLVHSIETWRSGVTDRPTEFYLNLQPQKQLCGDMHLDIIEAVQKWKILSTGLRVRSQGEDLELVVSDQGVKGVRSFDLLRSVGPDYDALVEHAASVLGYRPCDMNFAGKRSVRAELAWQGDSIVLMDGAALEQMDGIIAGAEATSGRIDGPFNAFLTLSYPDGDSASLALSTDGSAAFFYRGAFFRYGDEDALLGLFGLTGDAFRLLTGEENPQGNAENPQNIANEEIGANADA